MGVIGKSGSGKSTLILALFRLIERVSGSIVIDGFNIDEIKLKDLRSNVTIIAQDVTLFRDTIRFNLDPFQEYKDAQLWNILKAVNLYETFHSTADGLDHIITDDGKNLSSGQKQLICLARAILKKTKILILDEATATIDHKTDELIQKLIKTQFADSTILSVAHRIDTILDYDRILVMDNGSVVDNDTPQNMLQNDKSLLYSTLVEHFN